MAKHVAALAVVAAVLGAASFGADTLRVAGPGLLWFLSRAIASAWGLAGCG